MSAPDELARLLVDRAVPGGAGQRARPDPPALRVGTVLAVSSSTTETMVAVDVAGSTVWLTALDSVFARVGEPVSLLAVGSEMVAIGQLRRRDTQGEALALDTPAATPVAGFGAAAIRALAAHRATLSGQLTLSGAFTIPGTLGVLPPGLRPAVATYVGGRARAGGAWVLAQLRVDPDGSVVVEAGTPGDVLDLDSTTSWRLV